MQPKQQRDNSMLTFEGTQHLGVNGITEKLTVRHGHQPEEKNIWALAKSTLQNLPFQKVTHKFNPPDAQPTPNGGIIILVTGQLLVR